MITTISRLVITTLVQLQPKTPLETIHHRTKAWTQEVTIKNRASEDHDNNTANTENTSSTALKTKVEYVVVPYTKGLLESFKKYMVSMGYKHTSRETLQSSKH